MHAIIILLLQGTAFAQDATTECELQVVIKCEDCVPGQKFPAELYTFSADDGTSRYVLDHGTMESGRQLSGKAVNPRRILSVYDQDLGSWTCTGETQTVTAEITNKDLGLRSLRPDPSFVVEEELDGDTGGGPFVEEDLDDDPPVAAEPPVFHPPSAPPPPDPEPVALPAFTTSVAPPPPPAPEPPTAREEEDEVGYGSVVPRVVGWAAPGGDPVWTGNAGDYPSSPAANRRGKFAEAGESQCPAGKLPAVLGTADHISGGRPAQDALDDARATDLAPSGWTGAYAIALRTAILGDQAAAVWCINPGDINPTSPEGREMVAAAAPPPAVLLQGDLVVEEFAGPLNLTAGEEGTFTAKVRNAGNAAIPASHLRFEIDGVTLNEVVVPALEAGEAAEVKSATYQGTSEGLHTPRAIADSRKEVAEANEWDNDRDAVLSVAAPPETSGTSEPLPFVLRKGAFVAFQYSTTFDDNEVAYPHLVAGGFVTFNLTPKTGRLGLEPYIGAGTDAESTHPCGANEDGSLTTCSGWYLSTTAGVRLPWAVVKKDTWQLMVFPDLGLVSDDITVGFTSWADLVSFQGGVELWLTGKVPFAVSLETGATRLSFLNDNQSHINGWAWPIRLDVKVAFK